MKIRSLFAGLLLAGSSAAHAAIIQLDFTASMTWGGVTLDQGADATIVRRSTTGTGVTTFALTGYFKLDTSAPIVVGLNNLSGMYSSEVFKEVSYTLGGKTFTWTNTPEVTNNYFGINMVDNGATLNPDLVRTTNASTGFTSMGSVSAESPGTPNGLIPASVDGLDGYKLFLNQFAFQVYANGLLSSQFLADQAFDWGTIDFTGIDNAYKQLFLQFTGTAPTSGLRVFQNASGSFTSMSLHSADIGGTAPVPEPESMALLALGLAGLLAAARRRRSR